jgi:hypothetical protein
MSPWYVPNVFYMITTPERQEPIVPCDLNYLFCKESGYVRTTSTFRIWPCGLFPITINLEFWSYRHLVGLLGRVIRPGSMMILKKKYTMYNLGRIGRNNYFIKNRINTARRCGLVVKSSWLHIQRAVFDSRHYQKKSSWSGKGSTQPHEYNWGATW